MSRLIDQRHAAKHLCQVVQALASGLEVARLLADALSRLIVDILVATLDQERSGAGEVRRDIVEGNVLAIEVLVDIITDFLHDRVVGRVVVEEGHVGEAQVCDDHGVDILIAVLGAEAVAPVALGVWGCTTRQSSRQSMLTKLAPRLKGKLEVLRLIVYIVVRKQHGLGLEVRIRQELHVEAVALRHPVTHGHARLGLEVAGGLLLEVVPDDDNFVERGNLLGQDNAKRLVELLGPLISLHRDSIKNEQRLAFQLQTNRIR